MCSTGEYHLLDYRSHRGRGKVISHKHSPLQWDCISVWKVAVRNNGKKNSFKPIDILLPVHPWCICTSTLLCCHILFLLFHTALPYVLLTGKIHSSDFTMKVVTPILANLHACMYKACLLCQFRIQVVTLTKYLIWFITWDSSLVHFFCHFNKFC